MCETTTGNEIDNMNDIILSGAIKNIQHSHNIGDVEFGKAQMICPRDNGKEDVINLRFKSFCNPYKNNDNVSLRGNIRSYSYKTDTDSNRVMIYVFTYFDVPEDGCSEVAVIDGRICKINQLRKTQNGKQNIHFIIANNLHSQDNTKRLNSYIPCIAWGGIAKKVMNLSVNTKIKLYGQLHSREHKKKLDNGEIEIRLAHEFVVTSFEVLE